MSRPLPASSTAAPMRWLPRVTVAAAQTAPEVLPRMDVAGFVGFARSGPVDVPVQIGDLGRFESVFGGPAPLLRDEVTGETVQAHLHGAVAAFFAGGGRTCWAVRVTAREPGHPAQPTAARALFPLPGIVTTADRTANGTPGQAFFRARAVGSWVDAVRVTAGVLADPVSITDVVIGPVSSAGDPAPVTCRLLAGRVAPHDLVRLTFSGLEVQFAVSSVDRDVVRGAASLVVVPVVASPSRLPPAPMLRGTTDGGATVEVDLDGGVVTVALPLAAAPPVGGVLRLTLADGRAVLFTVREARAEPRPDRTVLAGLSYLVPEAVPAASTPLLSAHVLTVELRTRIADGRTAVLGDLGCVPSHPRYAGDLPTDEQLYGEQCPPSALRTQAALPRFDLAGPAGRGVLHPLGPPPPEPASVGPVPDPRPSLRRDGLDSFGRELFLDPALADVGARALLPVAEFVRDLAERPRPLVGIHSLLAVEDVTLLAVPDAVHGGWTAPTAHGVPDPPAHVAYERPRECNHRADHSTSPGAFADADPPEIALPVLDQADVDPLGTIRLSWGPQVDGAISVLEETATPYTWNGAREVHRGPGGHAELHGRPAGTYAFRVRTETAQASSDWSTGLVCRVPGIGSWTMLVPPDPRPAGDRPPSRTADLHAHVLNTCAARGDILAVLATPSGWPADRVAAHAVEVRGLVEDRTASFGAVYHPWPLGGDGRAVPPDGPVSGLLAALARERGAWIAPANKALTGVVGVDRPVPEDRFLDQLTARLNPLLGQPRGVLALSAETLALDADLGAIGVRRLLSLLRRAASRHGQQFVFESDDPVLRRSVRRRFEALLDLLLARGALAGAGPDEAYQVAVSGRGDALVVEVKVAPSVPLRFLTVLLVAAGDGSVAIEEV